MDIQSGYSLGEKWIFTFRVIGGGDRGVEKYRFFKIDARFSHFTIKKKPPLCKFAPY